MVEAIIIRYGSVILVLPGILPVSLGLPRGGGLIGLPVDVDLKHHKSPAVSPLKWMVDGFNSFRLMHLFSCISVRCRDTGDSYRAAASHMLVKYAS